MKETEQQKKEYNRLDYGWKQTYNREYSRLTLKDEVEREYRIHENILEYIDLRKCFEKLQQEIEELKNN